jgi:hypothetical protein
MLLYRPKRGEKEIQHIPSRISSSGKWPCEACHRTFATEKECLTHMADKHDLEPPETDDHTDDHNRADDIHSLAAPYVAQLKLF